MHSVFYAAAIFPEETVTIEGDAKLRVPAVTITATVAILIALLYGKHQGNPPPNISPG